MFSLFSSFDCNLMHFPFFVEVYMFLFIFNFCYSSSFLYASLQRFWFFMSSFFSSLKKEGFNKSLISFLLILMMLIFISNFSSIFPFNFAYSSQISIVFYLSSSIWLSYMIFYFMYNIKGFISHCIPEGTPFFLIPMLFLIDLISNFIRPVTLTVRLVANILAGHLLLILLSKVVYFSLFFMSFYFILNLVEFFVSLIQAYIFCTMLVLYYSEMF